MDRLAEWLANNLPPGDEEERLIHGDFRIDNVIFHPTEVLGALVHVQWALCVWAPAVRWDASVGVLVQSLALVPAAAPRNEPVYVRRPSWVQCSLERAEGSLLSPARASAPKPTGSCTVVSVNTEGFWDRARVLDTGRK